MERRFDMSDFERSLKDHADQFKMVPSKRVWNGIYNNLHPGSKWPSISIAIVFIITLISIGNLNNSPAHSDKSSTVAPNNTSNNIEFSNPANNISNKKDISEKDAVNKQSENAGINAQLSKSDSKVLHESSAQNVSPKIVLLENNNEKNKSKFLPVANFSNNKNFTNEEKKVNEDLKQGAEVNLAGQQSNHEKSIGIYQNNSTEKLPVIQSSLFSDIISPLKKELLVHTLFEEFLEPFQFSPSQNLSSSDSKAINITDFNSQKATAITNTKKIKTKKNKNIEWTFYAAPTIGTVSFNKKRNITTSSSNVSSVIILPNDPSFGLIRTAKIGFETGAEMSYKIFRKFSFITGANFSYSGYNNISNLIHPTFASLNFLDRNSIIYSKSYVTNYGNGQSPNRIPLTNYSFEMSVPLGLQCNIWGNEKIQVNAVSTVDPSIVLKKNAFIISSDGRYYINDPSLVRNINIVGHFGSYISFSVNKIKWHIGPDIRYQLLSTYKSYYPSKEHFIDYGIRIGISR